MLGGKLKHEALFKSKDVENGISSHSHKSFDVEIGVLVATILIFCFDFFFKFYYSLILPTNTSNVAPSDKPAGLKLFEI